MSGGDDGLGVASGSDQRQPAGDLSGQDGGEGSPDALVGRLEEALSAADGCPEGLDPIEVRFGEGDGLLGFGDAGHRFHLEGLRGPLRESRGFDCRGWTAWVRS